MNQGFFGYLPLLVPFAEPFSTLKITASGFSSELIFIIDFLLLKFSSSLLCTLCIPLLVLLRCTATKGHRRPCLGGRSRFTESYQYHFVAHWRLLKRQASFRLLLHDGYVRLVWSCLGSFDSRWQLYDRTWYRTASLCWLLHGGAWAIVRLSTSIKSDQRPF